MPLRKGSLSAYIRKLFYFYTLSKTLWFQVAHWHIPFPWYTFLCLSKEGCHFEDHLDIFVIINLNSFFACLLFSLSISCSLFLFVSVELMIMKYYLTLDLYRWMDRENVNTVKLYSAVKKILNNIRIWKVYFLKKVAKKRQYFLVCRT